jgi:ferredoxin
MIANYGYKNGSGEYFISIDTVRCNGCGDCVDACPYGVLEVAQDEYDPLREEPVARVSEDHRNRISYSCAPCKTASVSNPLPCVAACPTEAIDHSW